MNAIVRDNGWKSRKLAFGLAAILSMFGFAVMAAYFPILIPMFDAFVGGVVAIAGLYMAGSVTTKLVGTKVPADQPAKKDAEPAE